MNPIATILTVKMMLDWLGETEKAARVERAVAAVIADGETRTYDMADQLDAGDGRGDRHADPEDGDGGGMTSGILRRGLRAGGLVRQSQGVRA